MNTSAPNKPLKANVPCPASYHFDIRASIASGRSFIDRRNKIGPITEPCYTTFLIVMVPEISPRRQAFAFPTPKPGHAIIFTVPNNCTYWSTLMYTFTALFAHDRSGKKNEWARKSLPTLIFPRSRTQARSGAYITLILVFLAPLFFPHCYKRVHHSIIHWGLKGIWHFCAHWRRSV